MALVYTLPVEVMVGVSSALTVVAFAGLIGWRARYIATRTRAATPVPCRSERQRPISYTAAP